LLAAVLPQELELKLGPDPFGDHCLAQFLGGRDHRQHHRFVLRVVADAWTKVLSTPRSRLKPLVGDQQYR
jgi:hypothetical protein